MNQKIALFTPPKTRCKQLNLTEFSSSFGKDLHYASKGRYAILHIVESYSLKNRTILLSAYMCETVRDTLKKNNYAIEYYDIDPEDLNPSVESIRTRLAETNAAVVIVPSLYGNPAGLEEIADICKAGNALMIDDAAQSYGAELNGKMVGTFGDGGVIAFSPGKATVAHMGALYWTNGNYPNTKTRHAFLHRSIWNEFRTNRQNVYSRNIFDKMIGAILKHMNGFLLKYNDISNDEIEEFEKPIIGGVLDAAQKEFNFRGIWYSKFQSDFNNLMGVRILKAKYGIPKPHKIVLVFNHKEQADIFKKLLKKRFISYYCGYELNSFKSFKGCKAVNGCIVELPIEDDQIHMEYIHKTIEEYLEYT